MKAISTALLSTALICSAVSADDWPTNQQANPFVGAPRAGTAPQFQPAPPSPLRARNQSVRNAGFTDDIDGRAKARHVQTKSNDLSADANRGAAQAQYTPPVAATQRDAQLGSGFDLPRSGDFGSNDDFAPARSENFGVGSDGVADDGDSFSAGNRVYVPPSDLGPSKQPGPATPSLTAPSRTYPPPAAIPQQRTAAQGVVPRDVLGKTIPRSSGARSTLDSNYRGTTTNYPDERESTFGRPAATLPRSTTPLPKPTVPATPRYGDGYRQAQVRPGKTVTPDVLEPPNYQLSNPLENAANTAANTVEFGARGVSNAIRNGAEQIAEEGRRRGNSYFLTLLALFASVGLNLYLGWIAWDTYNRYQDLVSDLRYTGPRRTTTVENEAAYSDASLVEPAAY